MHIPLEKLDYTFQRKPLLVGGKAMEYYGLRPSGADIDFIADPADVYNLIRRYPHRVKDLWGDRKVALKAGVLSEAMPPYTINIYECTI